ncbi:hypothetical protein [Flavobacterium oreochromis]|uniref:hypothetical protein n=1 Tax=Flavobacterium oreochromis TaxID=2906078 RepID=UPI00216498CC|nr:hypothetical protein [Flavobacterium oreochromis]
MRKILKDNLLVATVLFAIMFVSCKEEAKKEQKETGIVLTDKMLQTTQTKVIKKNN